MLASRHDVELWLAERPSQARKWFATRYALRALPRIWEETDGEPRELLRMAFRCMTAFTAETKEHTAENRLAAKWTLDEFQCQVEKHENEFEGHRAAMSAADAIISLGTCILRPNGSDDLSSLSAHAVSMAAFASQEPRGFPALSGDDADPFEWNNAIWANRAIPWKTEECWNGIKREFQSSGGVWDYWIKWYEGLLLGKPLDWEIQKAVAQIPNATWGKGSEAVADKIARIETEHELKTEIEKLRVALNEQEASIAQRSHNNPPELVEEIEEIRQEFSSIRKRLENAEEEVGKDNPSPLILRKIAGTLMSIGAKFGLYSGSLFDAALKKSAEELGATGTKWAIRGGTAYFVRFEQLSKH